MILMFPRDFHTENRPLRQTKQLIKQELLHRKYKKTQFVIPGFYYNSCLKFFLVCQCYGNLYFAYNSIIEFTFKVYITSSLALHIDLLRQQTLFFFQKKMNLSLLSGTEVRSPRA